MKMQIKYFLCGKIFVLFIKRNHLLAAMRKKIYEHVYQNAYSPGVVQSKDTNP